MEHDIRVRLIFNFDSDQDGKLIPFGNDRRVRVSYAKFALLSVYMRSLFRSPSSFVCLSGNATVAYKLGDEFEEKLLIVIYHAALVNFE